MKRFFSITGILVLSAFLLSSFSLRENPQDPPRGKKMEKHIKIVKTDDEGNKIELDTVISDGRIFAWNGDTISGGKELKWISEDMNLDSLHENMTFDFEFSDDEGENVFIMKSGDNNFTKSWNILEGDSTKEIRIKINSDDIHGDHDVMMWNTKPGNKRMIVAPKIHSVPSVSAVPHIQFFGNDNENIIDLSDSGIISYKKKKMSGGREKITIIRNEPEKKKIEHVEEIIIDDKGNNTIFFGDSPKAHKITVKESDDGNIEVIEDENIMHLKSGDETLKIIEEDGKLIKIREIKKGHQKEIEVEIEVEEESGENN